MPRTIPQRIIFTVLMAGLMVYGMIVYNVSWATGELSNQTFLMAFGELPIMFPIAFILEFFFVEKLAAALAFRIVKPTDRPIAITLTLSTMIVLIMCPLMSLIATILFGEISFSAWVLTWVRNMPMALLWQLCYCGPFVRLIYRFLMKPFTASEQSARKFA